MSEIPCLVALSRLVSKRLGYLEDALSVFRRLHDVTPDSADVMSQVGLLLTFAFHPIVFVGILRFRAGQFYQSLWQEGANSNIEHLMTLQSLTHTVS